MSKTILSQARVRALFDYNPETGAFSRKIHRKGPKGTKSKWIDKSTGYCRIWIEGKTYRVHRVIWLWMTGNFPVNQLDHDNRVRSDNRWCNLKEVTNSENQKNVGMNPLNTSGITGVHYHIRMKKWIAQINIDKKQTQLGAFVEKSDAILARKEAETIYGYHPNHGRHA